MKKQHLLRTVVAAAACSVLVVAMAPTAYADPAGDVVGFVDTDGGWVPHIGDTSGWTNSACTPRLHAEMSRPEFTSLTITPTWMSMTETSTGYAYIAKWDCGSRAVIGAFRMTDYALYSLDPPPTTGWMYGYGEDLASGALALEVTRSLVRDEPTFTGTTVIEAGAWWGKPDPVTGQMVYYPAGCKQQAFLYTVVAWSGTVEAQPNGPKTPCTQPPLPPGMGIIL